MVVAAGDRPHDRPGDVGHCRARAVLEPVLEPALVWGVLAAVALVSVGGNALHAWLATEHLAPWMRAGTAVALLGTTHKSGDPVALEPDTSRRREAVGTGRCAQDRRGAGRQMGRCRGHHSRTGIFAQPAHRQDRRGVALPLRPASRDVATRDRGPGRVAPRHGGQGSRCGRCGCAGGGRWRSLT